MNIDVTSEKYSVEVNDDTFTVNMSNTVKGEKGDKGEQGIQGEPGENGFCTLTAKNTYVIAIGDSITLYDSGTDTEYYSIWGSRSYINHLIMASNGALKFRRNSGIAGESSTAISRRIYSQAILYKPGIIIIMAGTNNLYDPTTGQAYLINMINEVLNAGIIAVVCTIPPKTNDGVYVLAYNTMIRNVVTNFARPDVILADANSVIDNGSGGWAVASDTLDGTHPTGNAARKMGIKIWEAILDSGIVNGLSNYAPIDRLDAANLVPNPLFNAESVGIGLPTGWTQDSGGTNVTYSRVAPSQGETLKGNWLKVSIGNGSNTTVIKTPDIDLIPYANRRMAFRCKIKTTNMNISGSPGIQLQAPGFSFSNSTSWKEVNINEENEIYVEFVAYQNQNYAPYIRLNFGANTSGQTVDVYIGEVSIYPVDLAPAAGYFNRIQTRYVNSGDDVLGINDDVVSYNTSSSAITVTLPAITSTMVGKQYYLKKTSANYNLTINPTGTDKVENGSSLVLSDLNVSVQLIAENRWNVLGWWSY